MAEHYIPSNPFYSATVLHSATEQYRPGPRNADVGGSAKASLTGSDDADHPLCMGYTHTMTGVRSQKGLSGSDVRVGVSLSLLSRKAH